MPRERLPLTALPAWMNFNNAAFAHVKLQDIEHKGHGLVTQEKSVDIGQSPVVKVPHDLVLNAEAVDEYAKEDRNFRQLLDACGRKSPRHDILLFLLVQLVVSTRPSEHVASLNPWTEYVKFLDDHVPVPTLWLDDDRLLLRGTSLETALDAKMLALAREFDEIRDKSSEIEFWYSALWENHSVRLTDWFLVDAWYRSRVLELPRSGTSLVPCLDMANHSSQANAYYEETPQGDVVLLLRPEAKFDSEEEITISYGAEKPAAEMLFSYGFLDPSASAAHSLTLPLSPLPGDPLGKAKVHIFTGVPSVLIRKVDDKVEWASPFAYISCLNEEDGLHFKLLQSADGDTELRMFWQEEDVTGKDESFEALVSGHELCHVFGLRVNMVISQRIQEQLERLHETPDIPEGPSSPNPHAVSAQELRRIERDLLEQALSTLEDQRTKLLAEDSVTSYLASMAASAEPQDAGDEGDVENEFS